MNTLIGEHMKLKKLVEVGVLIPGIYSGKVGNITYTPISTKEYIQRIKTGSIQGLSYNTRTMGRGIFTLNNTGKIINFKGVDSHLSNNDSIAVQNTKGDIQNINDQDSYGINLITFIDTNKNKTNEKRYELRTKGASQYQNLLYEKTKRDEIEQRDTKGLVKLPEFDIPTPLSKEMCERFALPRVIPVTDEYLRSINPDSYAGDCLEQLKKLNISFSSRNQLWQEFFKEFHPEKLQDPLLLRTIQKEDSTYSLGVIFGQTTRKLDNPFRIMELKHYLDKENIEAVRALIDYSSSRCEGDLLEEYSKTAAKNVAGFMNLDLAINNFEHRQDYPLSGEICDDAFDDISKSIHTSNPNHDDYHKRLRYNNQVYIFATNMKIIEDAYKMLGKEVPKNYQETFLETFYDSLNNKENFKNCFRNENPMKDLERFNNATKNFEGMEEYLIGLRPKAVKVYKSKNLRINDSHDER